MNEMRKLIEATKHLEESDLSRELERIHRQYGPKEKRPAASVSEEYTQKREEAKELAKELAMQYDGNQFEKFANAMRTEMPDVEKVMNLEWAFDFYNPDRQAETGASWASYGDKRAEKDPSVVGLGPGGARSWTGD